MDATMMLDIEMIFANGAIEMEPETTGQRIFWLRKQVAKLKQKELTEAVGIAQGYMSEIEADKKEPSASLIARIADVLSTTTDYLLLRTDNPSPPRDAEPTSLSEEAEVAARTIDGLPPEERKRALAAVKDVEKDTRLRQQNQRELEGLLESIEVEHGPTARQMVERYLSRRIDSPSEVGHKMEDRS